MRRYPTPPDEGEPILGPLEGMAGVLALVVVFVLAPFWGPAFAVLWIVDRVVCGVIWPAVAATTRDGRDHILEAPGAGVPGAGAGRISDPARADAIRREIARQLDAVAAAVARAEREDDDARGSGPHQLNEGGTSCLTAGNAAPRPTGAGPRRSSGRGGWIG